LSYLGGVGRAIPVSPIKGDPGGSGHLPAFLLIHRTSRPAFSGVLPIGTVVHLFAQGQYSLPQCPSLRRLQPWPTHFSKALRTSLSG